MELSNSQFASQLTRRRFLKQSAAGFWIASCTGVRLLSAEEAPGKRRTEKQLRMHSEEPRNGEPPLAELAKSWITPIERFYIRTHGTTPVVDAGSYRLKVGGLVDKELSLSLEELSKLPQTTSIATMTCAGNRRAEMSAIKPIAGVPWEAGAIGNARWGGVRLSDFLKHVGVKEGAKHIWFESSDAIKRADGSTFAFGGSIPIERAMADREGVPAALLATQMNEAPLPVDHGFPIRGVVPGFIGARSVKWLSKIVLSDRPSPNHFLAENYKIVKTSDAEEMKKADPLYEFGINSVICTPANNAGLKGGAIEFTGYALPAGISHRTIEKVQLSSDGGRNWTEARLTSPRRDFCWQLWSAQLKLPVGNHRVLVRAVDSSGVVQPESCAWNAKGYMNNAWHSAVVSVQ